MFLQNSYAKNRPVWSTILHSSYNGNGRGWEKKRSYMLASTLYETIWEVWRNSETCCGHPILNMCDLYRELRFPVTLHILQEQFSFWAVTTTLKDIFFYCIYFCYIKTLRYLCYRDGHISRYGYSSVNSSFNPHLFFRASVMRLTLFWQNRGHMMNPCFWSVTVKMKVWCFFIPSCMCLK